MPKRKTNEEFLKEVYDLVGDEYTFLEKYMNSNTRISCRHNKCGNVHKVFPQNFLRGSGCLSCAQKKITDKSRKTKEEFRTEVFDLVGDVYTVVSDYVDTKTKVRMKHNSDTCRNHQWEVSPNNFLNGSRCPKCKGINCGRRQTLTHQDFLIKLKKKLGEEYIVLEEYVDMMTRLRVRHDVCGYEYHITPNRLLYDNHSCWNCSGGRPITNEEFLEKVSKIGQGEYIVLTSYNNWRSKVKVKHKTCGNVYDVLAGNLLRGNGCLTCFYKGQIKSDEDFRKEVYELTEGEYVFLEKYKNALTKIRCRHNECGHEWMTKPNVFLGGSRCPRCKFSKGERAICDFLDRNNILYITQYKIDSCKNINPLPFDVYLSDFNILIEFDGEQHFRAVSVFGGEEGFRKTQLNDSIKNKYCVDNNIPLLRIPYWKYDEIEYILFDFLVEHGVIKEL